MSNERQQLEVLARNVSNALLKKALRMAAAESCTGGWVSAVLTGLPGSSRWFEGGIVSYSNAVKQSLLQVPASVLASEGGVSEATARAMAVGVRSQLTVDIGLAVTGVAGPAGGSADKPVGTVWVAWASSDEVVARCYHFPGDRQQVRYQSMVAALEGVVAVIRRSG